MKLALLGAVALIASVSAQSTYPCTFTDNTNGNMYDLSSISKAREDYVIDGGGWTFNLNVCRQVVNSACPANTGVCQSWDSGNGFANVGSIPPTYQSLSGACGVAHENFDWVGNDTPNSPYTVDSAAACCTQCKSISQSVDAYAFMPSSGWCWCKRLGPNPAPPTAQEDRIFGYIGSRFSSTDGFVAHYTNGDRNRATTIYFQCNPNVSPGAPEFLFEQPALFYYFQWVTSAACRIGTSSGAISTTGRAISTTGPQPAGYQYDVHARTVQDGANSYTFNLESLIRLNNDYLTTDHIGHTYALNIGRNTVNGACGADAGICQYQTASPSTSFLIGKAPPTFAAIPGIFGIQLQFNEGLGGRKAWIDIICAPNHENGGMPVFLFEDPQLTYCFVWYTNVACQAQTVTTGVATTSVTTAPMQVTYYSTQFHDGDRLYDLYPLFRQDQDWVTYDDQNRPYYINVGRSTHNIECGTTPTFICQLWSGGGARVTGGAPNNAVFSPLGQGNKHGLILTLSGGDDGRTAVITFLCGDPFSLGTPVFNNEDTILVYHFTWVTSAACGKPVVGTCNAPMEGYDYSGYDSGASPYGGVASASACCDQCKMVVSNAYAYSPSQKNCWCKSVPIDAKPYLAPDRTYATIGGSITPAPSTGSKKKGLTGLETFFIIVFVFMALGAAGYAGWTYYKKRQDGNSYRPSTSNFSSLQTNDLLEDS